MEISNNYNINFGAKFGPNLKKQLNKREGNGNPLYADFVEDTFNKIHDKYLLKGLTIEHANNERLEISHELYPEITSNIFVRVPKGSTLSQRVLNIPPVKYIYAQDKIALEYIETSLKYAEQLKMVILAEICKPISEFTDEQIKLYKTLKDDITKIDNNIKTINNELNLKRVNIAEQVEIAKQNHANK